MMLVFRGLKNIHKLDTRAFFVIIIVVVLAYFTVIHRNFERGRERMGKKYVWRGKNLIDKKEYSATMRRHFSVVLMKKVWMGVKITKMFVARVCSGTIKKKDIGTTVVYYTSFCICFWNFFNSRCFQNTMQLKEEPVLTNPSFFL